MKRNEPDREKIREVLYLHDGLKPPSPAEVREAYKQLRSLAYMWFRGEEFNTEEKLDGGT